MTANYKLCAFTLLAALVVVGGASSAMACTSCGVPAATYSAGYAAPVTYQAAYAPAPVAYQAAYAPAPVAYTTAYAPVASTTYNTGWYPGYWLGRVNRSIWGAPTTTYYAPAYTASYAQTAYYAPNYSYASYAPACSTCGTCSTCAASYAPAPTCSACSASYAPACSTCGGCSSCGASYAPACSSCSTCDAGAVIAPSCPNCTAAPVSQATYTEPVAAPPATTYIPQSSTTMSTTAPSTSEHAPTLAPNDNVAPERTQQRADKPVPADPPLPAEAQPQPQAKSTDDSATNLQAPKLFDPNDRTAQREMAPMWTAVYHKVSGAAPTAQPVSLQQAESDATGWTSASE